MSLSLISNAKHKKLEHGYWHTEFQLGHGVSLPVTFQILKEKQITRLYIINADEKIKLPVIGIKGDSIFLSFSAYDSELRVKVIEKNYIRGVWLNHAKKNNYFIPFWSRKNDVDRFNGLTEKIDVLGKWEVSFNYNSKLEKAIGLFEINETNIPYKNNKTIKGTFLTETGDYRYLEGVTSSDSLYLSTFDGTHAFLFYAKMVQDTLWGMFYSGTHYKAEWFAVRNVDFELKNADSLTYVVNKNPISFELMDLNNTTYVYPNQNLDGKVVLIQIMGTWCPNCLDESRYLIDLKNKYGDKLKIITVTFETQKTLEEKINRVKNYKENLGLNWTFLIGGDACKSCAGEIFPQVNEIISFPTLIFIDKKGEIQRIHTGFSGPGTGKYYADFVKETNFFIDLLIKE